MKKEDAVIMALPPVTKYSLNNYIIVVCLYRCLGGIKPSLTGEGRNESGF